MTAKRPLAFGGAIVAFVLVVVWMMPPTTPKAAEVRPAIPHRLAASPPASTLTPVTDASFVVPPPPPPLPPAEAVTRGAQPTYPMRAPSDAYRDSPPPPRPLDEDRYAYFDPQEEYDRGYRWAERRQTQDARECRRWANTLAEDGCLAFLQDKSEEDQETEAPDDE